MSIKFLAVVEPITGNPISMRIAKGANNPDEGVNESYGGHIIHVTDDISNLIDFMNTKYYNFSGSAWATRDARPNDAATWTTDGWVWTAENFLTIVRDQRSVLLFACDWSMVTDSPLSDSEKSEVIAYRTALRDITTTTMPSSGLLDDVSWPTKPSCI